MKTKVVHLVYSFGCGGLEKVIVNLINASDDSKFEHVIISLTNEWQMLEQLAKPIQTHTLHKPAGNDIKSHFKLFQLLKNIQADTLQTYNFGTIEYHLIAKLAGVKNLIHSDHGRGGDDPQGNNQVNNLFRRFVSLFLSHYVVVSFDLKDWVINKLKINKNKVQLIFNGVEIPKQPSSKSGTPLNFVTVGRLDPIKNQTFMIEAFEKALTNGHIDKKSTLTFIGDGPERATLVQLIQSLNIEQSIKLVGYKNDIQAELSHYDAFLLSSHYEAMPMTILEASANGLPVISTNVGGISKFISASEVWLIKANSVTKYEQALHELQNDKEQRQLKKDNAYALVKDKYSLNAMAKLYERIYTSS